LTWFSKNSVNTCPLCFGVNNLLLQNFLESVIPFDSKSAEES
jgi:hypothetical protein